MEEHGEERKAAAEEQKIIVISVAVQSGRFTLSLGRSFGRFGMFGHCHLRVVTLTQSPADARSAWPAKSPFGALGATCEFVADTATTCGALFGTARRRAGHLHASRARVIALSDQQAADAVVVKLQADLADPDALDLLRPSRDSFKHRRGACTEVIDAAVDGDVALQGQIDAL